MKRLLIIVNSKLTMATFATKASRKAQLREKIVAKLSNLTIEEKQRQSQIVFNKLVNSPEYQNSRRISTFLSIDNEIDTKPIVERIFQDGKECFIPRYNKKGMQMVKLYSMKDWENLPKNNWGIKQPLFSEQRENALEIGGLDLVIAPGVAFSPNGWRLGHGDGYYDAFFHKLKQMDIKAISVGVALKEQIVDEIPVNENDVKIDVVLYDDDDDGNNT